MSSRIRLPGDPRPVEQVAWRQIRNQPGLPPETAAPSPDPALISRLEQQCAQKVRDARNAAYREGEAAGKSAATAEVAPVVERLARGIDDVAGLRPRLRKQAEADVLKLALAIARRVIRRELAVDPDALAGLLVAALEKLQGHEILRARVHPSHVDLLRRTLGPTAAGAAVEVTGDLSLEPGAAIFETERGNLDASVSTQLEEIERGLADRLRRHA